MNVTDLIKLNKSDLFRVCRLVRRSDARIVTYEADDGSTWIATRCVGSWQIIRDGKFVATRVNS